MSELKPCPFCGSEASVDEGRYGQQYQIFCTQCLICTDDAKEKDEAISDWNKRVPIESSSDNKD